ncbi:MAG: type II toxin-antitoxin system YoeB family toxin [Bacteroidia bacterium]|nr:type II toxin-antitoxin system YoeB family toxin [Bacteroidia bacterium]
MTQNWINFVALRGTKYSSAKLWSRRINGKDKMIYEILDDLIIVDVLSAMGHYSDK